MSQNSQSDSNIASIEHLTRLVRRQALQINTLINNYTSNGESSRTKEENDSSNRFQQLKPPVFEDAKDPIEVKNWIYTTERVFTYAHISESEKVICVSFMLRGNAGHWWDTLTSIGEAQKI